VRCLGETRAIHNDCPRSALLAASPYVFDADRLVEISYLSCKRFVEAEPNTTYIYIYIHTTYV
jgi:hypothetical protein